MFKKQLLIEIFNLNLKQRQKQNTEHLIHTGRWIVLPWPKTKRNKRMSLKKKTWIRKTFCIVSAEVLNSRRLRNGNWLQNAGWPSFFFYFLVYVQIRQVKKWRKRTNSCSNTMLVHFVAVELILCLFLQRWSTIMTTFPFIVSLIELNSKLQLKQMCKQH